MNKVKFFVIFLVCILTSCNKEEDPVIIGDWNPVIFDNPEIEVSAGGGTFSSRVTNDNYSDFFIYQVYVTQNDDKKIFFDAKKEAFSTKVTGDWFSINVADNDRKKLELHIDPNTTGKERKLYIILSASISYLTNGVVEVKQKG